mgnify:CR=1 FL=1
MDLLVLFLAARPHPVPRFPILALDATPRPVASDPAVEVLRADVASIPELVAVEREVLEFDRGDEFRWLLGEREGSIVLLDSPPLSLRPVVCGAHWPV